MVSTLVKAARRTARGRRFDPGQLHADNEAAVRRAEAQVALIRQTIAEAQRVRQDFLRRR